MRQLLYNVTPERGIRAKAKLNHVRHIIYKYILYLHTHTLNHGRNVIHKLQIVTSSSCKNKKVKPFKYKYKLS